MKYFYLLIVCFHIQIYAHTPLPQRAMVTSSTNGKALFKLIPDKIEIKDGKPQVTKKAFGIAYKLNDNGELVEQWQTKGWYTFEVYISDDAKYLVRIGPHSHLQEPSKETLALIFYKKGKLLKKYSTADLADKKINDTFIPNYRFWFYDKVLSNDKTTFELVTIDNIKFIFDLETGEILKQEKAKEE